MVKVKICGITNIEDARLAVDAGCNALGFVFYKKSPRYIRPEKAKRIAAIIPKRIKKVGVFVNAPLKQVKEIACSCHLEMLQLHGDEAAEFCAKLKGFKVIKAFRIKKKISLEQLSEYKIYGFLFDTFVKSKAGGSGKKFNWNLLPKIDKIRHPVFISGGLSDKSVRLAIKRLKPAWVDVSTSLEASPGKKDHIKIQKFIKAAKG